MMHRHTLLVVALALAGNVHDAAAQDAKWYRGNTHVHTTNSDGNASPDVAARWYREHGYAFVVITDHEYLTDVAPLNAQLAVRDSSCDLRPGDHTAGRRFVATRYPTAGARRVDRVVECDSASWRPRHRDRSDFGSDLRTQSRARRAAGAVRRSIIRTSNGPCDRMTWHDFRLDAVRSMEWAAAHQQ